MKILNQINRTPQNRLSNKIEFGSLFRSFWLLLLSSIPMTIQAQSWHSLNDIQNTAKNFLEEMQGSADNQNIEVIVSRIDPRTRLAQCAAPLKTFLAPGARSEGKTTVGVSCEVQKPWKIYLSARVVVYDEVWVLTRNLSTTDVITKLDLEKQRISKDRLRKAPLLDLSKVVGSSPKRRLRTGSVIFHDSVCLVCRGQVVNVSAKNAFLSINVEGIALADAALGETAKVRNSRSKRVFDAIVTGKNQMSVALTSNLSH